jgi:hypothetical protein
MTDTSNPDPTRRAKQLLALLRGAGPDDTIPVTPADTAILDRGLCSLIDNYAAGKKQRDWMEQVQEQPRRRRK